MARLFCRGTEGTSELTPGTGLLAAIRRRGLPIARACGGRGVCDSCVVRVVGAAAWLTERTAHEDACGLGADERLACLAALRTDAPADLLVELACSAWAPLDEAPKGPRDERSKDRQDAP